MLMSKIATAWHDYRNFRRNLFAIVELEQRFAADLHDAEDRLGHGAGTALDVPFLHQSCRALAEAAEDALAGIRSIGGSMPDALRRDANALLAAARRHLPDLDTATGDAVIAHFDRHGGPEALFATIAGHLEARVGRYRAGTRALRNALGNAGADRRAALAAARTAVFASGLYTAAPPPRDANDEDPAKAFAAASERAVAAIRAGEPVAKALAERNVLAARLYTRDPLGAVKLGITPGPWGDPEPILCFIFGLGWAMCVVILVASVASHGVDEDEDDDTTGGEE